jgi:hypothetical protein
VVILNVSEPACGILGRPLLVILGSSLDLEVDPEDLSTLGFEREDNETAGLGLREAKDIPLFLLASATEAIPLFIEA